MRWPILLPATVLIGVLSVTHGLAQPVPSATTNATDSADAQANIIRQKLVEWDRSFPKISLQDLRKTYYTQNQREAVYFDWVAHENWETGKTEQAIRDKWGREIESQFAHLLTGTTQEDDQGCDIKVDGDRATISWNIKDVTPLPLIKIDGHWLVDGHSLFEKYLKVNPDMEAQKQSSSRLMKKAVADITSDKFDDGDAFIKDFQSKLQAPPDGN